MRTGVRGVWGRISYITLFLIGLVLALKLGGCGTAQIGSGTGPLPTVEALENPQLPDWIEQISPLGEAAPTAQIRVRFKEPLIPLEALESKDQQDLLKKFELVPPLPGQFRFLTPRMVGFQADQAVPKATRVRVTLKAGLGDLKNHKLDKDLAWTFNTEALKILNLPGATESPDAQLEPFETKPLLKLTANVELDQASLKEHFQLTPPGSKDSVPVQVELEQNDTKPEDVTPGERFDPSDRTWTYAMTPQRDLQKATRYRLEITPGLRPAKGNLPSEAPFKSQIETYGPLTFQKLMTFGKPDAGGAFGRFTQGAAQLAFNNGIDAESATANITISPEPKTKDLPLVQAYQGEKLVNINPWSLEPATDYTITINGNLKDKFGQTLGKTTTVNFQTGDVAPDLWAPTGLNIFPTGKQDLQLNISTVNLPSYKASFNPVEPADLVYFDSAYPKDNGNGLVPNVSTWKNTTVKVQKNQTTDVPIPLQQQFGGETGMLAYGVQAQIPYTDENGRSQQREATFYGLVQRTDLGVFAQWFPESGLVRVHRLSNGSPVANATVQVYLSKTDGNASGGASPCATGKTDPNGTAMLTTQALQQCMGGNRFTDPPKLLVVAQQGRDWAFTRTNEYSGAYEFGIDAGWDSGKPESRGTIFSDRQLYQPGETAQLTGVAYYLQNGDIQQDKNARYTLRLDGPNGQKQDLGTQTTNEFGTFSLKVPIAANQPLGYYYVKAKGANGVEILGDFRVAEFKPPNFKVDLSLQGVGEQPEPALAIAGQSVEAKTQSNYLFGAPVEGGKVNYYVTRQQTQFTPKGWEGFNFGRQWFWPEEAPNVATDVLQTNQILSNAGEGKQTVKVDQDLPFPMTYRVDAQVTDVSNLAVSNSQSFVALPGDRLIGLQSDFVAEAGKEFPIKVIVTDPTGKPQASQRVKLELQQMNYSRVSKLVEGSRTEQNQVEYNTIATQDVQADVAPATATLTPTDSGSYRIRATLNGNQATATDIQIWATGPSSVGWGSRYRNNRLEIKLDQETYKPGDTATALIQSPYPEGELYFSVVRHNTLLKNVTKVSGGAPRIQFQVTPEMLPNAAVEAVLVRQGKPLAELEPGSLDKLVRIGFAPFKTNLDSQYLKVETQVEPSLQPGAEQTVKLTLRNAQDQPAKGQLTVMVVNEAILQLTNYRVPDLVKTVFAEQPISTRLSDNRPDVVVQPLGNPIEKGWGFGGGFSAGAGNTRVRTEFKPLAYYNASVMTDAIGNATVKFNVPDDLTTWRVMTVATDGDLHFGTGDTTFITTKPLIASPLLPQFARPGDRLQVGVAVTNNMNQSGNLSVNGTASGPVKLENASTQSQIGNAGTSAYRFPLTIEGSGDTKVQFNAQLGNASDAFELPLEIRTQNVTEQVIETGTTQNEAKIPLNVDKNVANDTGGLDIALASTLVPTLTAPAQQVLDESNLPFLEPAASQLAIAANLQTLSQTYGQSFASFNPKQQADLAIERLQKLQKPDGGFAAYPNAAKSDPFVTPYAAEAIASANQAFKTNNPLVASLTAYLKKVLADPGQYDFCKQNLCKNQVRLQTLIALAALGEPRNDFLSDLYAARDQFDPVDQIRLAQYLSRFPDWQAEAKAMANQLQETVSETGRTATVNLPPQWQWLNSQTTAQAQALQLAIAQKTKPEVIDRLLQGLLAQRRNGTWQSTHDNREALDALVAYSRLQPTPPNFEAIAQLAGKTLLTAQFQGYQKPSATTSIPMAELPRDRHDLIVKKSGQGLLHYLATYRYRLQGSQPGQLNGLRVTRTIRAANQDKVLYKAGIFAPDPLKLPVGQVYDVGVEVITDHPVNHLVITDPLPASFEAVDNSFQTTTPYFQTQGDRWELSYRTIYKDRVVAYGDKLDAGVYTLHYLVRSVTPGNFSYPGAEAHLQYAPEEFGRSAATLLEVTEK